MVKKPAVFLMDEPLSNLDAKLRNQMRAELIELHQKLKTTFVYVTHDQIEAMSMGDKIVLLDKGKIKQEDTPRNLYDKPKNKFTAQFIGTLPMNVLDCSSITRYKFSEEIVYIGFRPEKAKMTNNLDIVNKNSFKLNGKVVAKEMLGSETLYKVSTEAGTIVIKVYGINSILSSNVVVSVDYNDIVFFDKKENVIKSKVEEATIINNTSIHEDVI